MIKYRLDLTIAKTALGGMQRVTNADATSQRVFNTLAAAESALKELFAHRLPQAILTIDRPLTDDVPYWFRYDVYCVGRQNSDREIMAYIYQELGRADQTCRDAVESE